LRPNELKAHELLPMIRRKEVTVEEAVTETLRRIAAVDGTIQAYITVAGEQALGKAKEADARLAKGEPARPLEGLPVAIKDNICTKGLRTTSASRYLEDFIPPYDATVVRRLEDAGAIIVGKTNLDEFAMGSSTENSAMFPTRNPWNPKRVPGGSSGGSAAAVIADEAVFALGSDTGGSIRQPASFCGIVGLKPSYGLVSRYGLIGYASSMDQIGPMTRDVRDCALILSAIAGYDPGDSQSYPEELPDYTECLVSDISGITVGVPKEFLEEGLSDTVKDAFMKALDKLEELGARIVEVSLPHSRHALAAYYVISSAEASSNLARLDGVRYGYRASGCEDSASMMAMSRGEGLGPEVKRRIVLGTYVLSAENHEKYFNEALRVRSLIAGDFREVFETCDCLVGPTSPTVAFEAGEKTRDPLEMYLSDVYTVPPNLAGIPGISVPCGFDEECMPVGLQIMAKQYDEETLLRVAYTFEEATEFHKRRPEIQKGAHESDGGERSV
jgi:aspartyl-tRNA(Asn)/glutamyl-tRNA(Gln) amidotransferase subunit A